MVDSVSVHFKNARVEKMPLNIRIQWNAGTACVSECVLKTLACRGLRVGPSKNRYDLANWRSYSRTEHFLPKICDFRRPFRTAFSVKNLVHFGANNGVLARLGGVLAGGKRGHAMSRLLPFLGFRISQ